MKTSVCAILSLFLCSLSSQCADLMSTGDWTRQIGASDLNGGAGSDLTSQYESAPGSTTLTISNTTPGTWRVYARRSDSTWNGSVALSIKRTSDGSGPGTISGASSYVQLTLIDTEICSGTGDRTTVGLQFRLDGMSKNVSPGTYSSTVIFTISQ